MVGRPDDGQVTRGVIFGTLVGFLGLYLHTFVRLERVGDIDAMQEYTLVIVLGLPLVVLAGAWFWAREDGIDEDLLLRLLPWMVGCTVVFVGLLSLSAYAVGAAFGSGGPFILVHLASGLGVSVGVGMGIMELRAIQQTREHVRSALHAQSAERERRRLEFLNNFLRHEVLNSVNVIEGYATLLLEAPETEESAERLETIRERSRAVAAFVGSIREILEATGRPTLEPVDLGPVVRSEAERVEDTTDADVTVDVPGEPRVLADDLLKTVFSNLLENAAEHGGERPHVEVSYDSGDDYESIHIVDDGPGIADDALETLFEPTPEADHGSGLFLVRNLVESYGGRIRVASESDGARFIVDLRSPDGSTADDSADSGVEADHHRATASKRQPETEETDREWMTAT